MLSFLTSDSQGISVSLCIIICFSLSRWLKSDTRKLSHIPSLTIDLPLLSYIGVIQFTLASGKLLQRGYDRYKGGIFKVPEFFRWHVIVSGKMLVEEMRKANDDELSFEQANDAILYLDYTFCREVHENPYHISVVRTSLTRNLGVLYPIVREELMMASHEYISPTEDWIKIDAFQTIMKIVCRTSNRIFVGLPLCRDAEFMELNINFTMEVVKTAFLFNMVPKFLRGFVTRLTSLEAMKRRAEMLLRPLVEERLALLEQYGDGWSDKPNDMLSWLIDASPRGDGQLQSVVLRVLMVNFGAIHTSSMSFAHALYHLAAFPEYQAELRKEVDTVAEEFGWTKEGLAKMVKVDSFIKESSRYYGLGSISLARIAAKDFTFSDGTFIPKGTMVSAAARAMHFDEENYANADVFDPWRFTNSDKPGSSASLRNQFVNTHPDFLLFGLGKHACPGRFFASTELKSLLANFVFTYDMRLQKDGVVPPPTWIGAALVPDRNAAVMFRRRQSKL
ncbi:cytochrome P450 [Cristinia sonorae]|uniref:Cytochrome P450 n=1 Tax=Cristinia sonorae TaxID=1940300 RepID=A0A8K0UTM7_9AGAR|nr:cytochrome P450 [Cristinia sonorae]